jgi:hypothetical protein
MLIIKKTMTIKKIENLQKRIEKRRAALLSIGPMRPGSITCQYRDRKNKTGEYYQLSYTHHMKSRTEHVWPEHLPILRKEVAAYRKHKKLCEEIVDLSIELSKAKIALLRECANP